MLLAPTTLSYYNDYQRSSTYAYSFNQVLQRGTSIPPVQRFKEINCIWFLDFDRSQLRTSIPGRHGKQIIDFMSGWNFHHVSMASVGGPILFSNKYAYSNLSMATLIISHKMDIHSMVKHDIQQKRDMLMVFPMKAWLSHNKKLIWTKTRVT